MADSLEIINRFEATIKNRNYEGFQGGADGTADEPATITVTGPAIIQPFALTDGKAVSFWDDDTHRPATWDYCHIVSDQDLYLQIVGTATNVVLKIRANIPFCLAYQSVLGAADTVAITDGVTPSVTAIDHITLSNVSGATANGQVAIFD